MVSRGVWLDEIPPVPLASGESAAYLAEIGQRSYRIAAEGFRSNLGELFSAMTQPKVIAQGEDGYNLVDIISRSGACEGSCGGRGKASFGFGCAKAWEENPAGPVLGPPGLVLGIPKKKYKA